MYQAVDALFDGRLQDVARALHVDLSGVVAPHGDHTVNDHIATRRRPAHCVRVGDISYTYLHRIVREHARFMPVPGEGPQLHTPSFQE